jgi:hypothetical protein
MLDYILRLGYYPLIDTGLNLDRISCDKGLREFTMYFNNSSLMYRDIYIGLYYALKSNLILNTQSVRIAISSAQTETRQFSLHKNVLFNENTTLTKYLKWTQQNFEQLSMDNYLDELIPLLFVDLWDINLPINCNIKVHKNGLYTATPKAYSTLASSLTQNTTPLSDPSPIQVADVMDLAMIPENKPIHFKAQAMRTHKRTHITPLAPTQNLTKMGIIAMDIETMKHPDPDKDIQIPVVITISHLTSLDSSFDLKPITKLFCLNKAAWANKTLDYAINLLWRQVIIYLHQEW